MTTHRDTAQQLLGDHADTITERTVALITPALDALGLTYEQRFVVNHAINTAQYAAMTATYRIAAGHTIDPQRRVN